MLPELTNMCKDFLLHKVDHDTSACIVARRIGKANSLIDVTDRACQVIQGNFQRVSQVDAFMEMPETDLQECIEDEALNVSSEDPVFEAVVTWVRHDVENRKSSFENLMENINLSRCSPQFLGEVVRKEPLMETMKCFRSLSDALYDHVTCPGQKGTGRKGYGDRLLAVYEDQCWILRDGESEWISQTSSVGKWLTNSSACMMGDSIVITGGNTGTFRNSYSKQSWKLTLPTMKWTALPDLNVARQYHATVCIGNKVYVLGGWNGDSVQAVEYLDKEGKSWHVACDMPSTCSMGSEGTSVSYNNLIYVFGGNLFCPTFLFDTVSRKWNKKANMPSRCYRGSAVVYKDRIYILDGNCCMSYNPGHDQCKTHSKPAVRHVGASAVVWKDRILLCGGEDTSVIEEYNPDTDTWSEWKHRLPNPAAKSVAVFAIYM